MKHATLAEAEQARHKKHKCKICGCSRFRFTEDFFWYYVVCQKCGFKGIGYTRKGALKDYDKGGEDI